MLYVTAGLAVLLLVLSLAARTGTRRADPTAQRPWYLAVSAVGVLTALSAILAVLTS